MICSFSGEHRAIRVNRYSMMKMRESLTIIKIRQPLKRMKAKESSELKGPNSNEIKKCKNFKIKVVFRAF